jgi:hypothetical protein
MIQYLFIGKPAATRRSRSGFLHHPYKRVRSCSFWRSGLEDEGRVSLVLNRYRGPAEEASPDPNGVQTPEQGRLGLEEAWEDASKLQELARKREKSRRQKAADQVALWREFMETERREIELRRDGQLARLLGAPLAGELPAMLGQLASYDQTQAERGLVALMSGGNTVYKPLEELGPEDMPARIAANRLRTTWLKERRDQWLGRGETAP